VANRARASRVCLGVIATAHGLKGEVKIRCFASDPTALTAYGPLTDETGTVNYTVVRYRENKGIVVAALEGVRDRNAAEALRGVQLFLDRSRLPATAPDEFYQADLEGLPVRHVDGRALGTVIAFHNYGAGDLVEVEREDGGRFMVPFTADFVPSVSLADGLRIKADDEWIYSDRRSRERS